MGWRGTLIAGICLALAASAFFWLEAPEQHTRAGAGPNMVVEIPTPPTTPLVAFKPNDVEAVTLTLDGETRHATRQDLTWTGTERPEMVNDLLVDLGRFGALSEIDVSDGELKDFGLAPPRGTIVVRLRHQPSMSIDVGNRNPPTTGIYLRFPASGRVVLAGALVGWEFEKTFRALSALKPNPSPNP